MLPTNTVHAAKPLLYYTRHVFLFKYYYQERFTAGSASSQDEVFKTFTYGLNVIH